MTRQSALYRLGAVALAVVAVLSIAMMRPVDAASSTPLTSLSVSGRGWGHGRGMSQYGALGYASVNHWTAPEILDHYYQNTSMGAIPSGAAVDPNGVRVDLRFMHGHPTTVAIGTGQLHIYEADGSTIRTVEGGAVRLQVSGNGFVIESAPGCGGPWTSPEAIESGSATITASAAASDTYDPAQKSNLLEVCGSTQHAWYEGTIQAVNHNGKARTVNVVPVERYLRGVVPNEVVSSWPEAALQAQAVAARSYLMAGDTRQQPYADTCDTARCQVYDGVFSTRKSNTVATNPRTDTAILATSGQVRLMSNGKVARTEFSSSSGGHTAGGTFPAVPDDGDALAGNRFHTWTETIDTANLVAHYGHGQLVAIEVTKRNGLGAFGGRVTEVKFTFEQKTITVDGNTARVRLGLRSDWFSIQ